MDGVNIQQLRWLGHIVRMNEEVLARRVFDAEVLVSFGRTKSKKLFYRLVRPTGTGAQKVEAFEWMCRGGRNPLIELLWPIK